MPSLDLSPLDVEVRAVLNRFVLFGDNSEKERHDCAEALARVAQSDEVMLHGGRAFQEDTLQEVGRELCDLLRRVKHQSAQLTGALPSSGGSSSIPTQPRPVAGVKNPWITFSPLIKSMLLFLSNCCLTDDLSVHEALLSVSAPKTKPANCSGEGKDAEDEDSCYFSKTLSDCLLNQPDPAVEDELLFNALDLVATLAANSSAVRSVFGRDGYLGTVLQLMKSRGGSKSYALLFAGTMTLQTLTMADTVNGNRLVGAGGLQSLVDLIRWLHPAVAKVKAAEAAASTKDKEIKAILSAPAAEGGAAASKTPTADQQQQLSDSELLQSSLRFATQTLNNLMKVPFDTVDTALAAVNWGKFGTVVAVDELKWSLSQERKRCKKLLEEYRALRAAASGASGSGGK